MTTDEDARANARDAEEEAARIFLRRRAGDPGAREIPHPEALARVERAWDLVEAHAQEQRLANWRDEALTSFRQTAPGRRRSILRSRGLAACAASLAAGVVALWFMKFGFTAYETGVGEQRVIELEDRSRLTLDSQTTVRVRFSAESREVQLVEGQAQFTVAKDTKRPFRVQAGAQTIIAVGTSFSVEYVDSEVRVAMIEGRVLVVDSTDTTRTQASTVVANAPARAARSTALRAGEALRVRADGATTLIAEANVDAATAWRQGKVIFESEPLGTAVRRLNRYSALQIQLDDDTLAALEVSGVFETGDSREFAHAVEAYLPLAADYSEPGVIHLRSSR